MATSKVQVTEGSGKNIKTFSFTEDAVTKEVQAVVLVQSDGTEITQTTPGQASAANSLPVVLATDDYVALATKVDDAAFTPGTSRVMVIGAEADETGPDSVDEGDAGALRMTLARAMHVNLRNASGTELASGAGTATAALRVTLASDAPGVADGTAGEYETVAASQTTQTLGATGGTGDYLEAVLIVPSSTSPGEVLIKDGSDTAISIFKGGSSSITDLAPIYVPLGLKSRTGAWQLTTGANETAIGIGNFT